MKFNNIRGPLVFLIIIVLYALLVVLSPDAAARFGREDGFVETCSAICYFLSALLMFYLFFRSKSSGNNLSGTGRNYFFLLLGLFLFGCFGEEISWGQRLLHLATPEWLKVRNNQGEINLHNLKDLEAQSDKTSFANWISLDRIITLFWLSSCLIIPVFYKFSTQTRLLLKRIHFPVVPYWIGLFFLLNFILENIFERFVFKDLPPRFGETPEYVYAILYLCISISFFFMYSKNKVPSSVA